MPDLSPSSLSLATDASHDLASQSGIALPAHLYGTRAALFYLLREPAPASFAAVAIVSQPAPIQKGPIQKGPSSSGPVLVRSRPLHEAPQGPQVTDRGSDPLHVARSGPPLALREMLLSDNFDFRSPVDQA
jgi:hypothetical protein